MSRDNARSGETGGPAAADGRPRRSLLTSAAAVTLGVITGEALAGGATAQATPGQPVLLSQDNTGATSRTGLFTSGNLESAILADPNTSGKGSLGVYGTGKDIGVLGELSGCSAFAAVVGNGAAGGGENVGVLGNGGLIAPGVVGNGGSDGDGIQGNGGGTGIGVVGRGGSTGGVGVEGIGAGSREGVRGVGGSVSGIGVTGTGGPANGFGVVGTGTGGGAGVLALGGGSGEGVRASAGGALTG